MKKNLLTLVIVWVIIWIWYYFLTKWPARNELVFAGNYQSFESMSGTIDSEIITVLDFYAPRCPSCRAAHKNIINEVNQLPENLQILNVDYDSNQDLRTKYWVKSQHTFVLIDRSGNKIKSIQWLNHVSEIIDFVWNFTNTPTIDEIISTGDLQNMENINNESDSISNNNTITNKLQEEKQSVGIYTDYESGKKYISDPNKKVVLFFHASRCPNCRQAESDILANKNIIDPDLVILKVDYDNSSDLKKKYGITSQTSYVFVNKDGSLNKKSIGLTTLDAIEKFIQ